MTDTRNRISFILYQNQNNKQKIPALIDSIRQLTMPPGFIVDVMAVTGQNRAAAYNEAIRHNDAQYKIYLETSAQIQQKNLLVEILQLFQHNPQAGLAGTLGSYLPSDAHLQGIQGYGAYIQRNENGQINPNFFHQPIFEKDVQALDSAFLVTSQDIPWDETSGTFFALAQCCRFRKRGYKILVPQQNQPWFSFACPSLYIEEPQTPIYEAERNHFLDTYSTQCFPLVSILIPTYNRPDYFEKTLQSALQQDYRNTEIIIGDDSTDTRTQELMLSYLEQHSNIHYYYHGGPLGGKGLMNVNFVLNHCHGKYINYLLDDDLFYPHKISHMMNGFLANEKEDIIFISSIRDVIDENGQMLGYVDAWCPQKTECPDLSIIGRKILYHFQNFIGEPTTVLLKKSHMYFNPDSQQYEFAAFHGITDRANTDVSTWLDLCTTPGKCIFMAEHLSILRKHSGQKSFDPPIMLASVLDWFNYATIAWLHHIYIQTESEYQQICKNWVLFVMERIFHYRKFHYSSELKKDYTLCEAIVKAIQTEEYEQALHLSITYMLSYIPNPDIILSLCEKNTAGYWCRKKINETPHT